jgi:predicted DNA-binding transcriptional regulator YafY
MAVGRIYRLLRLVTLLQEGKARNADELAEDLQVHRRTIFRDLNAL